MPKQPKQYPNTPDGRYFVVRGRLWRSANPDLPEEERRELVQQLMKARREVGVAKRAGVPPIDTLISFMCFSSVLST